MNSSEKGDRLEDAFYQYLVSQLQNGELVYDAYPPENCKIFRKKSYFCSDRNADVEFDVVIELYRTGRMEPHSYIIFECKNHNGNIGEIHVNDFTAKIGRMFTAAVKGVMVISSQLQSGAENVARKNKLGIIKYDANGLDVIADRKGGVIETGFVRAQIIRNETPTKSLKFSAFSDGAYHSSLEGFLKSLNPDIVIEPTNAHVQTKVPFITVEELTNSAKDLLRHISYEGGAVDLPKICAFLSIDLQHSGAVVLDVDGLPILGSANFTRNLITINANGDSNRERFTLGHEIGHFYLDHKAYLASESIVEKDLRISQDSMEYFNYERLEFQANAFSSSLILPDDCFKQKTAEFRHFLDIQDKGHGYIFVDDQACNYLPYNSLLTQLSINFAVSKRAIEIKLRRLGLLTDQRNGGVKPIAKALAESQLFQLF